MYRSIVTLVVLLGLPAAVLAGPGKKVYDEFEQKGLLIDDPRWAEYVQAIGDRLIAVSDRPGAKTKFVIVDVPDVNANAWPDGYIFIFRGLLALMQSEDQLASVIGHEIGHNLANHYNERLGKASLGNVLGWAGYIMTGVGAVKTTTDAVTAVMVSGFGREQELEADRIGAELLAKAGYNPMATIEMLQALKDQETFSKSISGGARSYHGLFASHPANDKRLHDIVQLAYRHQAEVAEPVGDFWALMDGLVYGDDAAEGVARGRTFYHSGLRFVVEFPEGWLVSGGAQNVSAEAPGGAKEGTIELARQDAVKGQNPRQYVQKTLKREDLKQGEDIEVNGFKGHLAGVDTTGSAAKAAFIAVVFKGNDVYYFKGEAGEQGDPAAFEASFRATVGSFRGMQASDIQAANRQRVRVIEARPGDTYRSLAARSSLRAHGEQTLRVMNHDYPVREPRAGNPIKIVE